MNFINNFFDKIYLINLPKDKQKFINATKELNYFNICFEKINGIYGYDFAKEQQDHKLYLIKDYQLKAIGCKQSHLLCYKDALKNNLNKVLHLEDDLKFNSYLKNIETILNELPNDWEFVWLGYYIHLKNRSTNHNISKQFSKHLFTATRWHSTHCFGYNLKSEKVRKIWNELDKYNYNHIDDKLVKLINKYNAKVFIVHPNLCIQNGETNKEEKINLEKSDTILWD